ncbi:hypothetical protein [Burkholderia cepacia]|uniref:hypothetical protein n=1 Tax=Burkholderia TaxID=32008 RepID=UPI00075D7EF4|nr:hypothetical protein [Burkholderia cepacia]KVW90431.1 hypothetical protein WL00_09645 [Burkholderia cepacia]KVX70466.1 hypothetical protein WL07_19030 [Burkholderia cepacia]
MKTIRERFDEIADKHPFTLLSLMVLVLGGVPLLLYSLSLDQVPDFTLTELTGTLIATFLVEIGLVGVFGVYSLIAGFAARFVLDRFYDDTHVVAFGQMGPLTQNQQMRDRLVRGRFIVIATVLTVLIWTDLLTNPFVSWASPVLAWLTVVAYVATYSGLIGLLLADGSFVDSRLTRVLSSVLLFGVVILGALQLVAHFGNERIDTSAGATARAQPVVYAFSQLAPDVRACVGWMTTPSWATAAASAIIAAIVWFVQRSLRLAANGSRNVSKRIMHVTLHAIRAIGLVVLAVVAVSWLIALVNFKWFVTGNRLPITILCAAVFAVWMLRKGWFFRKRQIAPGGFLMPATPATGRRNGVPKLVAAKLFTAAAFAILSLCILIFADLVDSLNGNRESAQTLLLTMALLSVMNWGAFASRGWQMRAGLCALAALVSFVSVPIIVQNPLLFPRMLVAILGFGNRHASSMALSGQQCATLAPFGVRCNAGKDGSITLTDVNIVNRLGSSMVVELILRPELSVSAGAPPEAPVVGVAHTQARGIRDDKSPSASVAASSTTIAPSVGVGAANVNVQTLMLALPAGDAILRKRAYGCDQPLLDQRNRAFNRLVSHEGESSDKAMASDGVSIGNNGRRKAGIDVASAAVATTEAKRARSAGATSSTTATTTDSPITENAELACVRITIPKDQVVSYTNAGWRTYMAGYSGYIPVAEKAIGAH